MRKKLEKIPLTLFTIVLLALFSSCEKKEKELLTESVSIKSFAVDLSTVVVVESRSEVIITVPAAMKVGTNPIELSPIIELVGSGYSIQPKSGQPVSFGPPSLLVPVVYTLTSPSGIKRLYSVRIR